jgi:t-SNARE complex subunit (syntaxin)
MAIDITSHFLACIEQKKQQGIRATPRTHRPKEESPFVDAASEIKDEIYDVMEEVLEYTRHYLRTSGVGASTAVPSYSAISISEQLQQASNHLEQLEKLLHDIETDKKNTTLSQSSHQRAHYHGILSFLAKLSQDVSQRYKFIHAMQQESANIAKKLFDDSGLQTITSDRLRNLTQRALEEENPTQEDEGEELSHKDLQMLKLENNILYDELDAMLSEANEAEQKAAEIGDLVNIFQTRVTEQAEQIEQLLEHAERTKDNLSNANENLYSAKQKATGGGNMWSFGALFRHLLLYILLFASVILILFDLVSS